MASQEHSKERAESGHRGRKRHRSGRRHDERDERSEPRESFLEAYWFEFTALSLFALGVFLLVERLEIKVIVWRALVRWTKTTVDAATGLAYSIWDILYDVQKSDLVGVVLILVAALMVLHKVRFRAIERHPRLDRPEECPKCGGDLERIRNSRRDRFLQALLRIRIKLYSCRDCTFRAPVWRRKGEQG